MTETCGCGAKIEDASIEQVREWRTDHRHEPPALRQSGAGGYATTQTGYNPIGFVVPEQTRAM